MRSPQKKKIELVFRRFIKAGLIEHDPEKVLSCMTDDIVGVGMGEQGLLTSLEQVRRIMQDSDKQDNASYFLDFRQIEIHVHSCGSASVCAEIILARTLDGKTDISGFMQSATLRMNDDEWKICAIHASPLMLSKESIDAYPFKFAENTLLNLKEELQSQAFALMNQSMPGGMASAYLAPGYPLYFLNDGLLDYLGYSREEFTQLTDGFALNFIHPDDREMVRNIIDGALAGSGQFKVRHRVLKKNGGTAWMLQRGRRGMDDEGRDVMIAVYVDVTEIVELQKKLEDKAQALQEKNLELQMLTDNVPGGVAIMRLDKKCTLLYTNPFFYHMTGYTPNQVQTDLGSAFLACVHPDDVGPLTDTMLTAYKKGKLHFECETRLVRRDHKIIWGLVRGSCVPTADGVTVHSVTLDITERKRMEQDLQLSEERFRIALEKTSNIIFDYDIVRGVITHSSAPQKTFDFTGDIAPASDALIPGSVILPEYLHALGKAFVQIRKGHAQAKCVVKTILRSGGEAWHRISMTAIMDTQGKPVRAVGMIEDITRQKEAELAYSREEQFREAVLADAMASYVINFTQDRFENCKVTNPLCLCVEPDSPYENMIQRSISHFLVEEDRQAFLNAFSSASIMLAFEKQEREIKLEYLFITPNGSPRWLETTLRLIRDTITGDMKGFMYVMDVDSRKKEQIALTNQSERDPLTGIYNKRAAENHIRAKLKTAEAIQTGVFMMIDVDRFKDVNDTYGHPFGDQVLMDAAQDIVDHFRAGDIVARMGGDEFCVFFCGMRSHKRVEEAAAALCDIFHRLYLPREGLPRPSCSIGIAFSGGMPKSFEQIYSEADNALYIAKKNGRDRYYVSDATASSLI